MLVSTTSGLPSSHLFSPPESSFFPYISPVKPLPSSLAQFPLSGLLFLHSAFCIQPLLFPSSIPLWNASFLPSSYYYILFFPSIYPPFRCFVRRCMGTHDPRSGDAGGFFFLCGFFSFFPPLRRLTASWSMDVSYLSAQLLLNVWGVFRDLLF